MSKTRLRRLEEKMWIATLDACTVALTNEQLFTEVDRAKVVTKVAVDLIKQAYEDGHRFGDVYSTEDYLKKRKIV